MSSCRMANAHGYFGTSPDPRVEGILPFELCADQMPSEVLRNGRTYELKFRPVLEEGEFRRARRGSGVMLELHTVKGSAGVIGCDWFAERVHECESRLLEQPEDTAPIAGVETHFDSLRSSAEKAVGSGDNDIVVVRRHEYHQLLSLLQVTDAVLLERAGHLARSWSMHRISSFERLAKTTVRSAGRQGKNVTVQVQGDPICVPKGALDELWSTLSHLVRNAVAHGIEPTQERFKHGKAADGRIALRAHVDGAKLKLNVSDDGRGVDWDALASKIPPAERPANDHTSIEITVPVGADVYVPASGLSMLPAYRSKAPPRPDSAAVG